MDKEHPEVKEIKNVCRISKTPKQVCKAVNKASTKKSFSQDKKK